MLATTMRAARLHEYGQPLRIDEIPVPRPGPGQVLVRVEGAGFCHSDLHIMTGAIRMLTRMPLTLGHENAGRVAAVGAGVTAVKEGDPVAVYGAFGCGHCDYCVAGEETCCPTMQAAGASGIDGGYAEYLLVPAERHLVRLDRLPPRDAAPLTDAALTPYRAIRRALPALTPDYPVLVVGAGGLGQYGISLLKVLTGCPVIAVDIADPRLATARERGADYTINSATTDALEAIRDIVPGGVAAAFDFVGSDKTLELAVRSVRKLGRAVQIGLAGGAASLKALDTWDSEVQFSFSLWGNAKELREVIALAEAGKLQLVPSELHPLDEINAVSHRLEEGKVTGRAVITP